MPVMDHSAFPDFPAEFRGVTLRPGADGYSDARFIFNARTAHERPALIARAEDERDVAVAARYASEHGVPLAIRAGGHGVDGSAMPDGALVLDLSRLKSIEIDPRSATARLGAGVLLSEMDLALHEHGLVVPAGTVSTTGVAGLTLGGGVGYNMRRYGATVDSLLCCEMVTIDGRRVRASAEENPDLFWALRGGGGNFGIVTGFEFQGRAMQPTVASGFIPFTLDQATDVLAGLREHMTSAPRELAVIGALTHCPPLPPVPATLHGQPVLMLVVVYTGAPERADAVIGGLAALGDPAAVAVAPMPWPIANKMLDVIAPLGRRVYTKGAYLATLGDGAIGAAVRHAASAPLPTAPPAPSTVQNFWALGGAITEDFPEDSAAFSREGAQWFWEVVTQWDDPADDRRFMGWADALDDDIAPFRMDSCYINLTTDRGPEWRKGAWGSPDRYQRLVETKAAWDPHNLLRYNKNIAPS